MLKRKEHQCTKHPTFFLRVLTPPAVNYKPYCVVLHRQFQFLFNGANVLFLFSVLSNPHGGGGDHDHSTSNTSYDICGANFCVTNSNDNENLQRPADSEIYEISSIYLACVVVAIFIIAIFVDPLTRSVLSYLLGN